MTALSTASGGVLSLGLALVIVLGGCVSVQDDPQKIEGRVGAYSLNHVRDLDAADQADVGLVVGNYRKNNVSFNDEMRSRDMHLIDSVPQRRLYDALCPTGPSSCRSLSSPRREALLNDIRLHAEAAANDDVVSAFLMTDDYRRGLKEHLPEVATVLRKASPGIPLVCGVAAPLGVVKDDGQVELDGAAIRRSVQNFSRAWCDYVLVYSYAPTRKTPAPLRVDWTMKTLLREVTAQLEARGWTQDDVPLIGGPQAFEFSPRAAIKDRRSGAIWRGPATREGLRTQVQSFCAHGAVSVVAYAWNAPGRGRVTSLRDREDLRQGLAEGARDCGFVR